MLYKTIALERLRASPTLYQQLREQGTLMATLDQLAIDLKTAHESWTEQLRISSPTLDPLARASSAKELALAAWEQQFALLDSSPASSDD